MNKSIVADTGPLIALAITDLLKSLPTLLGEVYVPQTVFSEATCNLSKPGAQKIIYAQENAIFTVQKVTVSEEFEILEKLLDEGEAEALELARQIKAILLIDEKQGRKVAQIHEIPVIGTAALIVKAKNQGIINSAESVMQILLEHGYHFSRSLVNIVLDKCGEKNSL